MLRRGYSPQLASGTIAAAGTLKSLIPPSLVMILYCVVSKTFIFDMFTAAIIPALLTIALNMFAIYVSVRLDPKAAPVSRRLSWDERYRAAKNAIPALALLLAVFGGLYGGVFTIVEAASVAAVLALVFALVRGRIGWAGLLQGLYQAASSTVMLYMILIGASIFTYCLTLARVPEALVDVIGSLDAPPIVIIAILMIAYIILGTVFEELSAILITLPVVLPIIVHLGYDPIWWGILNVMQVEVAMIHPPMGIVVFLLHGLAPEIPMRTIYRGVVPFIIADLAVLVLLIVFPAIALWLPHVLAR
jgi:tripartite ATP-independent transporter DctM subunit